MPPRRRGDGIPPRRRAAEGPAPATADRHRWHGASSAGPGKPALTWWFDQDAIDAEAATDGWYALLTNLDTQVTAAEMLLRYKGQEAVERRYGNLKGPLAVTPMFSARLITVIRARGAVCGGCTPNRTVKRPTRKGFWGINDD